MISNEGHERAQVLASELVRVKKEKEVRDLREGFNQIKSSFSNLFNAFGEALNGAFPKDK